MDAVAGGGGGGGGEEKKNCNTNPPFELGRYDVYIDVCNAPPVASQMQPNGRPIGRQLEKTAGFD